MVPILCIVGKSGVGKTSLLERLVPELTRRGVRVAVVKHTGHTVEWDHPDSDTWRFQQAGSEATAISGPGRFAVTYSDKEEVPLKSIAGLLAGRCDILLAEGYKEGPYPKIEVRREDVPSSRNGELLAVVSDDTLEVSAPMFSTTDVAGVADLVCTRFLTKL